MLHVGRIGPKFRGVLGLLPAIAVVGWVGWGTFDFPWSHIDDGTNLAFWRAITGQSGQVPDVRSLLAEPSTGRCRPVHWLWQAVAFGVCGERPGLHHIYRVVAFTCLLLIVYLVLRCNMGTTWAAGLAVLLCACCRHGYRVWLELGPQELPLLLFGLGSAGLAMVAARYRPWTRQWLTRAGSAGLLLMLAIGTKETAVAMLPAFLFMGMVRRRASHRDGEQPADGGLVWLMLSAVGATTFGALRVASALCSGSVHLQSYASDYRLSAASCATGLAEYGSKMEHALSPLLYLCLLSLLIRGVREPRSLVRGEVPRWQGFWLILAICLFGIQMPWTNNYSGYYVFPALVAAYAFCACELAMGMRSVVGGPAEQVRPLSSLWKWAIATALIITACGNATALYGYKAELRARIFANDECRREIATEARPGSTFYAPEGRGFAHQFWNPTEFLLGAVQGRSDIRVRDLPDDPSMVKAGDIVGYCGDSVPPIVLRTLAASGGYQELKMISCSEEELSARKWAANVARRACGRPTKPGSTVTYKWHLYACG